MRNLFQGKNLLAPLSNLRQKWIHFGIAFIVIFVLDQAIKWAFLLQGYQFGDTIYETRFLSLLLVYNKGVAFSMFAFLGDWLKFLQILLLGGILVYLWKNQEFLKSYALPLGIIFGAGFSNILDRFLHGGVVDYIFWHYQFEFAIFNFADVMIDLGVILILYQTFLRKDKSLS